MNKLNKVFKTGKPIIGMVHFMPLLGYKDHPGLDKVLKKALKDAKALEDGGVDAIILENNYDYPHKINVSQETIVCMTYLTKKITERINLPIGLSVLWNDYKTALSIAKVCGGKFVRVPVFVDTVKTQYDIIKGESEYAINYRKKLDAEDVLLLCDIHVKHSTLLSRFTLDESAQLAIKKGADGVIVTGKWTGDKPTMEDLMRVKQAIGDFPILVGSGATSSNTGLLMRFATGVIIGTSLKTGKRQKDNVNIKGYNEKIDEKKVRTFVKEFKKSVK